MSRPRSFLFGLSLLFLLLLIANGCRDESPSLPDVQKMDTASSSTSPSPLQDTVPALTDTSAPAVAGEPRSQPLYSAETRAALVRGVRQFITVIDSNDQQTFWTLLSQRSRRFVDQDRLASQEDVWNGARQTLGDIDGRSISIIGGTPDSASLLVEGRRLIDSERVADPVIIHMLREDGAWKVMYPGLMYPKHHLRR